jgi:hypothetical protein
MRERRELTKQSSEASNLDRRKAVINITNQRGEAGWKPIVQASKYSFDDRLQ